MLSRCSHLADCVKDCLVTTSCFFSSSINQAGVGMRVDEASHSSDGFCVVREIHRGGAVDISGYEQKNGEMRRVQVGDWLLRVNDISCKHMPRPEVKRYIVGPADTKVELVFASKRDNKNITVQLLRMPKEKGTEVEVAPDHERDRSLGRDGERERDRGRDRERERDRGRGRSPRQEI